MTLAETIAAINRHADASFSEAESWFHRPETLRRFRAPEGGWTINEVLEHIVLVNHFLLLLINKNAQKAAKRATQQPLPDPNAPYEPPLERYAAIADAGAFNWPHLPHMAPTAAKTNNELLAELQVQHTQCHELLQQLRNGEGIFCRTTLNVNGLGKTDVYGFIYFLLQHMQRHLRQMEKIAILFNKTIGSIE